MPELIVKSRPAPNTFASAVSWQFPTAHWVLMMVAPSFPPVQLAEIPPVPLAPPETLPPFPFEPPELLPPVPFEPPEELPPLPFEPPEALLPSLPLVPPISVPEQPESAPVTKVPIAPTTHIQVVMWRWIHGCMAVSFPWEARTGSEISPTVSSYSDPRHSPRPLVAVTGR